MRNRRRENSSESGDVSEVAAPLVIRYRIGRGWFRLMLPGWRLSLGLLLKRPYCLLEIEDLPERDPKIQQSYARNSTSDPAGSNYSLQTVHSRLARRVE